MQFSAGPEIFVDKCSQKWQSEMPLEERKKESDIPCLQTIS